MIGEGGGDLFSFGRREGTIIQVAYTVADIDAGMQLYGETLGIGPWFKVGPFVPQKGIYRGAVTDMQVSLAIAYMGTIMVELIAQHDDKPSVFREFVEARGGHGFHHWAIGARDFDATLAEHQNLGYEAAFTDISPRGVRIVHLDTKGELPGMLEIIEMTPGAEAQYTAMKEAADDWDGAFAVYKVEPKRPEA